jgi:hypothetical protein
MIGNEQLQEWVPSQRPKIWLFINTSLVLYSLIVCVELVVALKNVQEIPVATAFYIIYNLITTLMWCLEAGLETLWGYKEASIIAQDEDEEGQSSSSSSSSPSWWYNLVNSNYLLSKIELSMAIFFLIDSGILVLEWHIYGRDEVRQSMYDVVLNLIFYIYAMVRDFVRLYHINNNGTSIRQGNDIDSFNSSNGGYTAFVDGE